MRRSICNVVPMSTVTGRRPGGTTLRLHAAATWIASVLAAVLLTACGGGSSDSGGGSQPGSNGTNTVAPPAASGNPFAGTYNAFGTITLSAQGVPPETDPGTIQFVIDSRGNVVSDPGNPLSGSGKLKGNSFTVSVPGSRLNKPGLNCSGALLIHGKISGTGITGTFASGGLSCNGIAIHVTGSFSGARAASSSVSRAPSGGAVVSALRKALGVVR